jgi:hypothetical protein
MQWDALRFPFLDGPREQPRQAPGPEVLKLKLETIFQWTSRAFTEDSDSSAVAASPHACD